MRNGSIAAIGGALVLGLAASGAGAAVSQEEAARLGQDLTPLGAERAGNEAGTIPAWDGGLPKVEPPPPGENLPNPYADEQKRFTITADNLDQYREHLTPGQIALFENYPDTYRMHVYPTHRSAAYPQEVYDATRENATRATLEGVDGVRGAATGFPYPIPQNGAQPIWNHKLKWTGEKGARYYYNQAVVTQGGDFTLVRLLQEIKFKYNQFDADPQKLREENVQFYFIQQILSPARLAGQVLLVHEPINQSREQRSAWVYNPGQRRVRRAPNVEHDNPGTASDGLRTNDQNNVFNGSLSRYNWELVGKREIYIPYNANRLDDRDLEYDQIIGPGHINQDLARYELHRVWVVDARVREDTRHLYKRRTFYLDEDSWHITLVDVYDNRDELWRVQEGHLRVFQDMPMVSTALETIYDLQSGRYLVLALENNDPRSDYRWTAPDSYFTPAALRMKGLR